MTTTMNDPCQVKQPPGWRCSRSVHVPGSPCAVEPDPDCGTCGNPYSWHEANRPRHNFTPPDGGGGINTTPPRGVATQSPRVVSGPFDPVLRQALMDAGIITPKMLRDAEDKIMVVTNQFTEAIRDGEQQGG